MFQLRIVWWASNICQDKNDKNVKGFGRPAQLLRASKLAQKWSFFNFFSQWRESKYSMCWFGVFFLPWSNPPPPQKKNWFWKLELDLSKIQLSIYISIRMHYITFLVKRWERWKGLKLLGVVTFEEHLKCASHTDELSERVSRKIGVLLRLKNFIPT